MNKRAPKPREIAVMCLFVFSVFAVLLFIWMERKVIADFQTRTGPMRAGPRGLFLTFADGLKAEFEFFAGLTDRR